jgi:WD40 repeat protein
LLDDWRIDMTEQKHLKAVIRARMARTGESYTAARAHIVEHENTPTLTPVAEFKAHDKHCMTAVFTPDDANIVSGGFGGQARIWTTDGEPVGELAGHESSVNVIRISADGGTAVTASSDKTVRTWDFPAREQRAILGKHKKQVLALVLDAAHDRVWSGGHDGKLQSWDLSTNELLEAWDIGGSVTSVAIRADGVLAAATVGAGISIRDSNGAELTRVMSAAPAITAVTWTADGSFLLASAPGGATVWTSDDWELVRTLASGKGGMLPVALSLDGRRIALGWDNHIGLWSADEDQPAVTIEGLPKGVYGLAFSHDGSLLANAAADGRVRTFAVT